MTTTKYSGDEKILLQAFREVRGTTKQYTARDMTGEIR